MDGYLSDAGKARFTFVLKTLTLTLMMALWVGGVTVVILRDLPIPKYMDTHSSQPVKHQVRAINNVQK
jgi:hypothetical protein